MKMHSWFLLLDIEKLDKSFVHKKYLALIVWCMLPQLIVVPLSVHLSLTQKVVAKMKGQWTLIEWQLFKSIDHIDHVDHVDHGEMAPNGQTGKPACLLRLKIGFRNLGFFLKYVGGSHWEHNKKLVNILCLHKSSFLDSQAFKRKSEQKGHNAVMIKLAIPNHQRNLIEWHLLMDFFTHLL